jgi:hypothetical protein
MSDSSKKKTPLPQIGPFVFPALLAIFGLWCFYDGWLTSDPTMQEHLLLNRIASIILLPWALVDFIRTRRKAQREETAAGQKADTV